MKSITLLLSLFITSSIFAQSPWVKDQGDLFVNLSYSTISDYDELFGDPDYNLERTITDRTYQLYGEYGLTSKTTILINLPLKSIHIEDLADPNVFSGTIPGTKTALGNIQFGLKHQFYNKNWILAGQISAEINTSYYNNDTGIRTGYDAATITPLFLAGKSFGKNFFQSFVGLNIRSNNYSSNFKIGGELGRNITRNFILIGFINISESFKDGTIDLPFVNEQTALYVNNQEYAAYGLKGILQFCDLGFTASFANAFSGNNVPKQSAFSIGIFNTF